MEFLSGPWLSTVDFLSGPWPLHFGNFAYGAAEHASSTAMSRASTFIGSRGNLLCGDMDESVAKGSPEAAGRMTGGPEAPRGRTPAPVVGEKGGPEVAGRLTGGPEAARKLQAKSALTFST